MSQIMVKAVISDNQVKAGQIYKAQEYNTGHYMIELRKDVNMVIPKDLFIVHEGEVIRVDFINRRLAV